MKCTTCRKRPQFAILFSELFWPDWKTGGGKGEPQRFPRGELVEITENGKDRIRVRITSKPEYQAFISRDCLVLQQHFNE
jgi:hypothetical protein